MKVDLYIDLSPLKREGTACDQINEGSAKVSGHPLTGQACVCGTLAAPEGLLVWLLNLQASLCWWQGSSRCLHMKIH